MSLEKKTRELTSALSEITNQIGPSLSIRAAIHRFFNESFQIVYTDQNDQVSIQSNKKSKLSSTPPKPVPVFPSVVKSPPSSVNSLNILSPILSLICLRFSHLTSKPSPTTHLTPSTKITSSLTKIIHSHLSSTS
eukprot:TRINITY_DN5336_c0_g2_i4.p1 TRINITY_DN5336_c0_g2~~TRINITY_DN5336_c0_g2_i4.p1  ORF type:complete len:135 (+),score=1.54 TRINITY_DN5336_c0_g2_i4:310-714(+)